MHMADALLSPAVGSAMWAASAGAIAYSAMKVKKDELSEKKVPVMAVTGAFVFAAQMINFTIPGTGSSGHIGGGILLAAVLGGGPALLALTAVLAIQCLFFADGGLLALGCNIFNLGVIPCLLVYPLIFKPILRKGVTKGRITLASLLSVVVGLQLGAFGVVLQTLASGITQLPFGTFVLMMQPIHLAIGIGEGLVTAAVLIFVYEMRPELVDAAGNGQAAKQRVSVKALVAILAAATVLVGGGLSLYASGNPDGLEWAIERTAGTAELEASGSVHEGAAAVVDKTAIMPDYAFKNSEDGAGTSAAGVLGGLITFAAAGAMGFAITSVKKRKAKV